jgi:hypothetical protein
MKTRALGRILNLAVAKNKPKAPPAKVVPNIANAPFGIQQAVLQRVIGENGVNGNFVFPLQRLVFTYCEKGGSSAGMRYD